MQPLPLRLLSILQDAAAQSMIAEIRGAPASELPLTTKDVMETMRSTITAQAVADGALPQGTAVGH